MSEIKLPEFLEKTILAGMGLINITEEKAKDWVDELVKRGEMSKNDAESFVKSILNKAETGTKNIEETVKKIIEKALEKALEKAHIPLKEDVTKLEKRVTDLEKKIKGLEKK